MDLFADKTNKRELRFGPSHDPLDPLELTNAVFKNILPHIVPRHVATHHGTQMGNRQTHDLLPPPHCPHRHAVSP